MTLQQQIETKLQEALAPVCLEVHNESAMHNVAPGSETHFRLLIVSVSFAGKSRLQRHREVYALLAAELRDHVHALGLQLLTPEEWEREPDRIESPECLGGDGTLG